MPPSSEFSGRSAGWMPRGACQGEDPELFFPIAATGPALAQVIAAKAVCFRCAVRAACLSYALATGQAGIWGGTSQEERHAMRRSSSLPAREHSASPRAPRVSTGHRSNPAMQ
jgi:WhiB family redox-sensing transcriptional regulator